MKNFLRIRSLSAAAVMLATGFALTPAAHASGRSIVVHGPQGGVYQRQINRTPGNFSASGTATLPGGRTASRSFATQRTDTGRTTTAQATGFNGRSATCASTFTRTDNGYTRQATATGPAGGTASKQVTVTHVDGAVTRTVTTSATPPHS
jgi:hypothetical protein